MHSNLLLIINELNLKLDQFFFEKCAEALGSFLSEVWLTSKKPEDIDIHLVYIACKYFDSTGAQFVNPDTGKSSYEQVIPRGLVLSKDDWKEIADNLAAGKLRDLNQILLLNAKCMLYENRPEIAILLAAIICEYKTKYICDILANKNKVPKKLWNTMVEKLRLSYSEYQAIMNSLGITSTKTSCDPKIKALPGKLQNLFEHRNRIVHVGSIQGYKNKLYKAIEKLLSPKLTSKQQNNLWIGLTRKYQQSNKWWTNM